MLKRLIKIFFLLGIAYFISDVSIDTVFLAQSPKINPFFGQNMMAKINGFVSNTSNFFAFRSTSDSSQVEDKSTDNGFLNQPTEDVNEVDSSTPAVAQQNFSFTKEVEKALTTPLTQVSQGVYAGKNEEAKVYEIRVDEIDSVVYTFDVNGKEIKIRVPKDKQPPTQEEVENTFE